MELSVKTVKTDSQNADFLFLVNLLDKELAIRDGDEHAFYHQFNSIRNLNHVVILYKNDRPVGCGAFKPLEQETVEIKRMFILQSERGKGYAGMILQTLEGWAKELDFKYCMLETGKKQPEAIALYKRHRYIVISNYGQYIGVDNSICMKKKLNNI